MASSVSALSSGQAATGEQESGGQPAAVTSGKDMFLKLLVEQIKNQDPLSPMQGMEFVNQLSQFTQLEEIMSIRQDLDGILANTATTSTPGESKSN